MKSDKKLKICYTPYFGYETGNVAFSDQYKYRWTNVLKEKLQKEGHSIATYDINTVADSDFIISFDNVYFQNIRHFFNIWKAGKLGRTLHIDYEPPSAMCRIHSDKGLKKLSKLFTVMTYNDNVVNGKTIIKGVVGDHYEQEKPYKKDFDKRKLLCMVANNRADVMPIDPWPSELYSKKKEIGEYFIRNHLEEFDLYGDYWPDDIQKKAKGVIERSKKIKTLSKYKFIVSYDSITNQNGYISEKIFDVFKAKAIPIYWGADNVTDYIPKECFIDQRDFSDYEELFLYLKNMTKEEYEFRIGEIEKYLKSAQYRNTFSSEAIADNIIEFIQRKPRHINYVRALFILLQFNCIRLIKPCYNYDNYYYDVKRNALAMSVYGFYMMKEKGKQYFSVHANLDRMGEDVNIYMKFGEKGKVKKIKIERTGLQGNYEAVRFRIPYESVYKYGQVAVFVRKQKELVPLKLSNHKYEKVTRYFSDQKNVWFEVKENEITRMTNMPVRLFVYRVLKMMMRIVRKVF